MPSWLSPSWPFFLLETARADEWSKTYNLTGKPDLRIETSDANIRVTTWDQNTIEAKVITTRYKIGEGGIRVEERQTGNSVEIDVRYPHHNFNVEWGQHKVDIIIQMPREGRVNLRTGDGKIDLAGLKGDMDLHTGDGSENLEGVDGKLHASTGDGHITAHGRFDELELKTGDGHVDVRATQGSTLATSWRLETGDGNVIARSPQRSLGRREPAYQRRPHRSRHAHRHRGQDSRERGSRQAQRRRQLAHNPHGRWIDSFAEGLNASERRTSELWLLTHASTLGLILLGLTVSISYRKRFAPWQFCA